MPRPTKLTLSAMVRDALKYYVYAYIDPRDGKLFYVGKGRGGRALAHLGTGDPRKARILRELRRGGLKPRIDILRYGLSEKEALLIEAAAIDLLGVPQLTNRVRGHGVGDGARAPIEELVARLGARPAVIKHSMILISISRLFRESMTRQELYDATRSAWVVNPKRRNAKFAAAVYRGVIREVYEIAAWLPAGTTLLSHLESGTNRRDGRRMEFVGCLAEEQIRRRYKNRSIAQYIAKGAQNPIQYVNC